jgi:hypothetical protein
MLNIVLWFLEIITVPPERFSLTKISSSRDLSFQVPSKEVSAEHFLPSIQVIFAAL